MADQNRICSSTGVLRNSSTYTVVSDRSSGLLLSRMIPTAIPSTVASTIPATATRIVFTIAATIAQAKLSEAWNGTQDSPIAIPAGRHRKPNPAVRFSRVRLPTSVSVSSATAVTSSIAARTCAMVAWCRRFSITRSSPGGSSDAGSARGRAKATCRSRLRYRKGGEYNSPPSLHSRLSPRGNFKVEPSPSVRS